MKKILVINGPNINMLGIREPEIYGSRTYGDLLLFIKKSAAEYGFTAECFQSNSEGAIVDTIQNVYKKFDGFIINPAAYTHTSVAIPDALKAVGIPVIEVHLTDIDNREDYRRINYVRDACAATVTGKGFESYREAFAILREMLKI